MALFSDPVSYYFGLLEGRGTIYYFADNEPKTSIIFELPPDLADAIAPDLEVGRGWSARLEGNRVVVSGGRLEPRENLQVGFVITRYLRAGSMTYTAKATTLEGETRTSQGTLVINEMISLGVLSIFSEYRLLILAGSGIGTVLTLLTLLPRQETSQPPSPHAEDVKHAQINIETRGGIVLMSVYDLGKYDINVTVRSGIERLRDDA